MNVLLTIIQLLCLFFLSTQFKKQLYVAILTISKNQKVTISFLSLLLFPGTVVHELSHFVIAAILLVPVSEMDLVPKVSKEMIRTGSVKVGKTDPFRQTVIGIAPLFVGSTLLYGIVRFLLPIQYALSLYLILAISATMFSSKKDMDAAQLVLPVIAIMGISAYSAGFRFELIQQLLIKTSSIMEILNIALIIALVMHSLLWFGLKMVIRIVR